MDTQGWEVSWERKNLLPYILACLLREEQNEFQSFRFSSGYRDIPALFFSTEIWLGCQFFNSWHFFYFLTSSFCWTSFCWIRARYKQKEVWFQGHSMSESDGSELNVLICSFEICLNVLFSLHRAYYSTPMVSLWEMIRFVCLAPNMKITEYQWLIHNKIKIKEAPHLLEMQSQLENKAFLQCSFIFQRYYSFII